MIGLADGLDAYDMRSRKEQKMTFGFWPEQGDVTSFEAPTVQEVTGCMGIT